MENLRRLPDLRRHADDLGLEFRADILTPKGWHTSQNDLLIGIVSRLLPDYESGTEAVVDAEQIDTYCPGLSTMIRSLHSSLWDSVGANPRKLKESDFLDVVHAMYAPYVNVFRADRYMAQHVCKHVSDRGVQVVARLEDLPVQIHNLIESRRSGNKK